MLQMSTSVQDNPEKSGQIILGRCLSLVTVWGCLIFAVFLLFGISQISSRPGSIFAGVTIIFFTYLLARDLISKQGALVAVFLVATNNFVVPTSHAARPGALAAMVVLFSLLAMEQLGEDGRILRAFASGLLVAVAAMVHVTVAVFVVSAGILVFVLDRLHNATPPGQTPYGSITFWMALHGHQDVSYERMDPWMAVNQIHSLPHKCYGDLIIYRVQ